MRDHDFIAAMSKGIPQITPPKGWEPVTHVPYDPEPASSNALPFALDDNDHAIARDARRHIEDNRFRLNALDALSRRRKA